MFRTRFVVALLLTVPTVVWGHMLPSATGWTPPAVPGAALLPPVFGIVVFLYGGWPFLQGAMRELRARLPGMMTLIARALVATAKERGLSIPAATEFAAIPGRGARAVVDGRAWSVGGPNLLRQLGLELLPDLAGFTAKASAGGRGAVYLAREDGVVAAFAIADAVRPESREAVRRLHESGIQVAMLTGDARPVAESVARELEIDTVLAEVLPEQKARTIEQLQQGGRRVAMVGDGVNDAPALVTAADVGIAVGAGTDVAVEAGDVVLVRSDPRDVPRVIALSRASWRKMIQNLWWAAGYNVFAIPLAAGVLAPVGVVLHPAVGALLMSVSTVVVAVNAQLLRREAV